MHREKVKLYDLKNGSWLPILYEHIKPDTVYHTVGLALKIKAQTCKLGFQSKRRLFLANVRMLLGLAWKIKDQIWKLGFQSEKTIFSKRRNAAQFGPEDQRSDLQAGFSKQKETIFSKCQKAPWLGPEDQRSDLQAGFSKQEETIFSKHWNAPWQRIFKAKGDFFSIYFKLKRTCCGWHSGREEHLHWYLLHQDNFTPKLSGR